ncbi:hypothetical protein B0H13DRAFT_2058457, partial [Mycena leptocephala]
LYPLISCFLSITVCILDVSSITQRNLTDVVRRFNWVRCQPLKPLHRISRAFIPPQHSHRSSRLTLPVIHPCHALPAPEIISAMCES